jgi:hypothetical protein
MRTGRGANARLIGAIVVMQLGIFSLLVLAFLLARTDQDPREIDPANFAVVAPAIGRTADPGAPQ